MHISEIFPTEMQQQKVIRFCRKEYRYRKSLFLCMLTFIHPYFIHNRTSVILDVVTFSNYEN